VFLADHLGEALWAVAAVEGLLRGHCGESNDGSCGLKEFGRASEVKTMTVGARGAVTGLVAAVVALFACVAALAGGLSPNPANHPRLLNEPIEDFRYDEARGCRDKPTRGMKALEKWLGRNLRGESWGIMRCERLRAGLALRGGNYSLHAEGRALDWHLDARKRKDRRAARRLIGALIARDRNGERAALARRMGVQGLIFNCKSWWSGQSGLGKYSYCYRPNGEKRHGLDPTAAHIDHVHIELNWPGARKRTSFWRSPLGD
jgi:hypothetical protein